MASGSLISAPMRPLKYWRYPDHHHALEWLSAQEEFLAKNIHSAFDSE